jgi:hypothetical protein
MKSSLSLSLNLLISISVLTAFVVPLLNNRKTTKTNLTKKHDLEEGT